MFNILSSLLAAAAMAADDVPSNTANDGLFAFEHVSCTGGPNEVRIVIDGVDENVGIITVDLYENDNDTFLKTAGRVARVRGAAKTPATHLCLQAPAPGDYAIALYHDKNANKALDRGAFGIPKEPWGMSNNPVVRFAPPTVEEALFTVPEQGIGVLIQTQ